MSHPLPMSLSLTLPPLPLPPTTYTALTTTVAQLLQPGKGILAADESTGTCAKRFDPIGLENTAENRQRYRELMLAAPGLEDCISGVILHEETLGQSARGTGESFAKLLEGKGIVPGIKTDAGLVPFAAGAEGEQMTMGLEGYVARLEKYKALGARFTKWRNVYRLDAQGKVSASLVEYNAATLAMYAKLTQSVGLVPIVEPEVLMEGGHSLAQCAAASVRIWRAVAEKLSEYGVVWEGMLLKPSMVVPGVECAEKKNMETTDMGAEIAKATVYALRRALPAACPGVVFLSGGLSEKEATRYLTEMNKGAEGLQEVPGVTSPLPWQLRFSYARALQSSALRLWQGKEENVEKARQGLLHRARMNSLATLGKYDAKEDVCGEEQSLFVKGYSY